MEVKVISCTSKKYVGQIFHIGDKILELNDLIEISHLTSKPFKVIKVNSKRITLQNAHVTVVCKFIQE